MSKKKERDIQELVNSHFRNQPYDILKVQKFKIDKMFEKIHEPVEISFDKEETLDDSKPAPGQSQRMGSTAAEFHAYRVARRKEMHRQELLENERKAV